MPRTRPCPRPGSPPRSDPPRRSGSGSRPARARTGRRAPAALEGTALRTSGVPNRRGSRQLTRRSRCTIPRAPCTDHRLRGDRSSTRSPGSSRSAGGAGRGAPRVGDAAPLSAGTAVGRPRVDAFVESPHVARLPAPRPAVRRSSVLRRDQEREHDPLVASSSLPPRRRVRARLQGELRVGLRRSGAAPGPIGVARTASSASISGRGSAHARRRHDRQRQERVSAPVALAWRRALSRGALILLVDFKGGSTFAELSALPHVRGRPDRPRRASAERALRSLRAEIRDEKARYWPGCARHRRPARRRLPSPPRPGRRVRGARQSFPELQELFADLAARGRSLGIHLLLLHAAPRRRRPRRRRANCAVRSPSVWRARPMRPVFSPSRRRPTARPRAARSSPHPGDRARSRSRRSPSRHRRGRRPMALRDPGVATVAPAAAREGLAT